MIKFVTKDSLYFYLVERSGAMNLDLYSGDGALVQLAVIRFNSDGTIDRFALNQDALARGVKADALGKYFVNDISSPAP